MPLEKGKSKEAFQHNVKKEIHSGKSLKQSLAIAYSQQRKNDILPTECYKKTLENYGLSNLKNKGASVNSPIQAREKAQYNSGQSYNQQTRNGSNYDRFGIRRK